MTRIIGRIALVLGSLALCPLRVAGQQVFPVNEEPRHRLMSETGAVQVLDIRILPGDTTFFHRHATPIAYILFDRVSTDAQELGEGWRGPRYDYGQLGVVNVSADYGRNPVTHRVTNVGDRLFHLLAITNSGAGRTVLSPEPGELPGSVEVNNPWYRISRVTLADGGVTGWHTSPETVVAVLAGTGRVRVLYEDQWSESLSRLGDHALVGGGAAYRLENVGPSLIEVILVQTR